MRPRRQAGASTRPFNFTVRRHSFVNAIVPPSSRDRERRVLRRVKSHRCSQACVAFCLLAAAAFMARVQLEPRLSIWAQLIGFGACGLAVIAAIGAVVYRVIETPREVTLRSPSSRWWEPPVIHLKRKG